MNNAKALKMAILALEERKREFAFDAGLAERFGSNDPGARRAKAKRDEIDEAIQALRCLSSQVAKRKETP